MDQLRASLLDLLHELDGKGIPIIVGGGFGLYLKRQHLAAVGRQMLYDRLPEPRSTNDLDLFLRAEILVDRDRTKQVAGAIHRLGYQVMEKAKYLQWKREVVVAGVPQEVKIDVLVGPLGEAHKKLHVTKPRVRPKGGIKFHAHMVEEAIRIEDSPLLVTVTGSRSTGGPYTGTVLIPQAFPYLMMKLHAFDDRNNKGQEEKEQHHALDLYTIVGMMTDEEYEQAKHLGAAHQEDKHVVRARAIVRDHFADRTATGILRLREHQLFRGDFLLDDFISVLREVFPGE